MKLNNKTVVIVDDDDDDLLLYQSVIQREFPHVRVITIDDSSQALPTIEQLGAPPSLILLDWHMPTKDGKEVLQELQVLPYYDQLRVAILTSRLSPLTLEQVQQTNALDFMEKPTTYASILSTIKGLLSDQHETNEPNPGEEA